jgi:DNA/RNA-binding domain of Phe-tRNA-synthetase-like protein
VTSLRVSEKIFRIFPETIIGVIVFQDIDNSGEKAEVLAGLRQEETRIMERFRGVAVPDHPQIAPWREAYRKFGAKPKDYPSSVENLVRRVLKGHQLPHINRIVDIYNTISLRHILPVGGEDLDQIEGDVELTFAAENEPPVKLLGESEVRPPKPGEVIYKDRMGAICRRWNWKEADRSKFTEQTRNGILVIEGLPPVDHSLVAQALNELAALVKSYCGGSSKNGIADASNAELMLR